MAILAAAIAPALIRYIDKSRRADDVTAAGSINSAMSAALANESAYDEVMSVADGTILLTAAAGATTWTAGTGITAPTLIKEMNSSQQPPKLKYKKTVNSSATDGTKKGSSFTPGAWAIAISGGKPIVWVTSATSTGDAVMLQPSINDEYK